MHLPIIGNRYCNAVSCGFRKLLKSGRWRTARQATKGHQLTSPSKHWTTFVNIWGSTNSRPIIFQECQNNRPTVKKVTGADTRRSKRSIQSHQGRSTRGKPKIQKHQSRPQSRALQGLKQDIGAPGRLGLEIQVKALGRFFWWCGAPERLQASLILVSQSKQGT